LPSWLEEALLAPIVDVWTLPYVGLYSEAAIHNAPASPDRFGLHQPSASLTWPAPWRMDFREIQGSSVRRAAALNIVDLLRYRPLATERNK